MKKQAIRVLVLITGFVMCGGPQYIQAQTATQATPSQQSQTTESQDAAQQPQIPSQESQASQPQSSTEPSTTNRQVIGPDGRVQPPASQQTSQQNRGTSVDPSAGPLTPTPQNIPDAPSATPEEQEKGVQKPSTEMTQKPGTPVERPQPVPEPLGTAAAEGVKTAGNGASRPAGAAIAPAKQSQKRGLLIKLGLIGAAGVALGTVYGLSRSSSSTPPNSGR